MVGWQLAGKEVEIRQTQSSWAGAGTQLENNQQNKFKGGPKFVIRVKEAGDNFNWVLGVTLFL